MVDDFFSRFTIVSESSMNDHIDILLLLKSLPSPIKNYSLYRMELINFQVF
jgi:hypothetical protein